MRPDSMKNKVLLVFVIFCYILASFLACHMGMANKEADYTLNFVEMVMAGFQRFSESKFAIGFTVKGFTTWLLFTLIFIVALIFVKVEGEKAPKEAIGVESGSARWNTNLDKYNRVYTDPKDSSTNDGPYNMILTDNVFMSMNTWQTRRNNNVMVVGGSGAGKSRFFVKPNLLQANCSYVITDPAGELLETQASFLEKQGYKIKVFNLVEMKHSNCYNPFMYIRDDLGVLMLINCLIKNTNKDGQSGGDPFWEKSETALLQALMFYLIKYRPKEEQNFTSIMKLLRAAEVDENNPNVKSPLDRIFDEVAKRDPNSIALKQYMTFKMGAGKTLKSILISCSVRLTVFNMKEIEQLTGTDDIDLGTLGDERQALFVVIPAADDTYNFLVSMMYSQLFETLYFHAETECKGKKLNYHVRFMLDEFANIGQIPEFTKKLATMRKYEISCSIILQNLAQLKAMYKDDWEGLIGNCDSFLFLGGQEYGTLEYLSKELGQATIHVSNTNRTYGSRGSSSRGTNKTARALLNPDEIMRMNNQDCILLIRGLHPFYGPKYDYPRHKNYRFTGDNEDSLLYDYRRKFNNEIKNNLKDLTVDRQKNLNREGIVAKKVERVVDTPVSIDKLGKITGTRADEFMSGLQGVGLGTTRIAAPNKKSTPKSNTKINTNTIGNTKGVSGYGFNQNKQQEQPAPVKRSQLNITKPQEKPSNNDSSGNNKETWTFV